MHDPSTRDRIHDNLERIRRDALAAAERSGRSGPDVTIVAVSKTVDRATMAAAFSAGVRVFGENRVQDAVAKLATPLPAGASVHLIGQLQTNKVKPVVRHFDVVESIDRPTLIDALGVAVSAVRTEPLPILLQVNIAGESQKAGCDPADAQSLVARILDAPAFALQGLMTIAPLVDDSEDVRPVFAGLRMLRDQLTAQFEGLPLPVLSMGMSNDFAIAIEEGATHIRIGRALFAR